MQRRLSRRHVLGTLGALGGQIGLSTRSTRAADAYTLRFTVSDPAANPLGVTALRMAAAVNRRSNGQVKIEVYPNGQLATQQGAIDGLATGVIDFAISATAFLVSRFPQFQVFDTPFLLKDLAAGYRLVDGPIGGELIAQLEPRGILGLGWAASGFRELETTTRPVVVPEDLKGLRMRVQNGAIYPAMFQALGAIPLTIDNSEAFVAATQHTIDGLDIPLATFTASKFYTLVKHVAMSNHILAVLPLLASKSKIEALPLPLQSVVREEGKSAMVFMRSHAPQQTTDATQTLKQNGVAFTEIQYPAFRKAMEPVYAMLQSKLGGDFFDRVTRAASA